MKGLIVFFLFCFNLQPITLLAKHQGQSVDRLIERIRLGVPIIPEDALSKLRSTLQPYSDVLSNKFSELQTDPAFLPYIKKYEILHAKYMSYNQPVSIRNIKIVFNINPLKITSHSETLLNFGFCFAGIKYGGDNIVVMDRSLWDHYEDNDSVREAMLFHELGHCDLHRNHNDLGIMNPNMIEYLFLGETEALHAIYGNYWQIIKQKFDKYLETSYCNDTPTAIDLESLYAELFSEQRDRSFVTLWSSSWEYIFNNGNKYRDKYGYSTVKEIQGHLVNDFVDSISSPLLKLACTVFDSHCEEFRNIYYKQSQK